MNKIQALQDKGVRIINLRVNNHGVGELYKNDKILRISDYIKLINCLIVRNVLRNSSIPSSQKFFIKSGNLHQHKTRHAKQNFVILTQWNIDFYSIKSIQHQAVQHGINFKMKQTTMFCKTFNQNQKS